MYAGFVPAFRDKRVESGTEPGVRRDERELRTVEVRGAWCAPGRMDSRVVTREVSSWMVLFEDELEARRGAIQQAQAARLGAWMSHGMQVPAEVVKSAMEADGVMMRVRGRMRLIPAKFADALDAAERQGSQELREQTMSRIVQLARGYRRGEKRFAKRARRVMRGAHGVWDPEAGVVILVDSTGLDFEGPEAVRRANARERQVLGGIQSAVTAEVLAKAERPWRV